MIKDCAFLVYQPLRQRRKDNSFDGNDNIGAKVIADALDRDGIKVGYVTPESAHTVPVVLVSLTSTYDVYALLQAVSPLANWQPKAREFKVLAGGFGMQNPTAIRKYIDYAAFGRAHAWVSGVVSKIISGNAPSGLSLMDMREFNAVGIAQGDLYPHEVEGFKESFTGCSGKCKFCHFTYARKHVSVDDNCDSYSQGLLTKGSSPEMLWKSIPNVTAKMGRVRVAIDGLSERLRYLYGKQISNKDIVDGINHMGSFGPNATTMIVYNVVNFPGETERDYQELVDTISQSSPKYRVIFVLHSTPFRPSLITPMQWEEARLFPGWSKKRTQVMVDRPNLRAVHSFTLETPWSHLKNVVAERATPEDDEAIHAICFSPKLNNSKHSLALKIFKRHFGADKWTAERPLDNPPAGFLSSYTSNGTLKKIARKMRSVKDSWRA